MPARQRELEGAAWIDVREQDEWDEGHIPGAVHVPRGNLESRIEGVVGDKAKPVVIYCASGARSAFAADSLAALGYEHPVSLAGGFTDWKRNGLEIVMPQEALAGAARALLAAPADPGDRRGGPAQAARRRRSC